MRKLFPILMAVFVVAAVVIFSSQAEAGGRRHGGRGHGWHRGWSGGQGWTGGLGWNRGIGRWSPGGGGWYPLVTPGAVIVDDWADCEIVRRCFVDRFGHRRCRWVRVCPW